MANQFHQLEEQQNEELQKIKYSRYASSDSGADSGMVRVQSNGCKQARLSCKRIAGNGNVYRPHCIGHERHQHFNQHAVFYRTIRRLKCKG